MKGKLYRERVSYRRASTMYNGMPYKGALFGEFSIEVQILYGQISVIFWVRL